MKSSNLLQLFSETALTIPLTALPLHPNISMHVLYTVLYTFPVGADKENLLNNQELL